MTRLTVMRDDMTGAGRDALDRFLANPTSVLSRWLVGRMVGASLTALLFGNAARSLGDRWALVLAVLGTLATYGVFTEMVSSVALGSPSRVAPFFLRLLRPLEWLTLPFAWPLEFAARLSGRVVRRPDEVARLREHEVGLLLAEGQLDGTLKEDRAQMLKNMLEFDDLMAVEAMIPRTSVTAIDAETTLEDALRIVSREGHSRYPVFRDSVDNIVGLLYAKDLFRVIDEADWRMAKVGGITRSSVIFVPETKLVSSLLREMRARHLHMAVVVDDYGGVAGIVTLEDIIEEIVGDIQDEHDVEESPFVVLPDGGVLVDAAVPIDDLADYLGTELEDEGDFVSLGGWIIHRAGRVPVQGAEVDAWGLRFVVREADERKISKVEIHRMDGSTVPPPVEVSDGL